MGQHVFWGRGEREREREDKKKKELIMRLHLIFYQGVPFIREDGQVIGKRKN